MSEKTQPVDLTKMRLARQGLTALQEELAGIEETEHEMEEVMKHVEALEYILGNAKNQVSFGSLLHIDVFLMLP
jgi:predicted component of type VI protein secretion system